MFSEDSSALLKVTISSLICDLTPALRFAQWILLTVCVSACRITFEIASVARTPMSISFLYLKNVFTVCAEGSFFSCKAQKCKNNPLCPTFALQTWIWLVIAKDRFTQKQCALHESLALTAASASCAFNYQQRSHCRSACVLVVSLCGFLFSAHPKLVAPTPEPQMLMQDLHKLNKGATAGMGNLTLTISWFRHDKVKGENKN